MLADKLEKYSQSGVYPFHMPGHKRNFKGSFPYEIDITEIDGFDNLHDPEECIRSIEEKAAKLYRSKRAFLLVNGATCGILAAVKALTRRGDSVIVARNCHNSVHHAIELLGLNPEYYIPSPVHGDRMYNMYASVDPGKIDNLLNKNPGTKLVVITSPTYEGIVSNVELIAQICHKHGAKLLVDEAHGAHFPFCSAFPKGAIECGADVSVVSLHKTMPSPTQTALLLTNCSRLEGHLQSALSVFQTSSPSYVLMSGIECCLDFAKNNPQAFNQYLNRLHKFESAVSNMRNLRLLFRNREERIENLVDYDIGKLVISTNGTNLTGIELSNILRNNYRIEVEMSAINYIIAMTSVCDTDEGFNRLSKALLEIDSKCEKSDKNNVITLLTGVPKKRFTPSNIVNQNYKIVPFIETEGKISHEDIFAYPPGIPIVVKGEIISKEIHELVKRLKNSGVNIKSSESNYPENLMIAEL